MLESVITNFAEASWLNRLDTPPGQPRDWGQKFVGDLESGPWIYLNSLEPDRNVPSHAHSEDEIMVVLEGEMTIGERICGTGTVIYNKAGTEYGFTVGAAGVLFVNIRTGLSTYLEDGETKDPWAQGRKAEPAG